MGKYKKNFGNLKDISRKVWSMSEIFRKYKGTLEEIYKKCKKNLGEKIGGNSIKTTKKFEEKFIDVCDWVYVNH